jgi:hypothetical protein
LRYCLIKTLSRLSAYRSMANSLFRLNGEQTIMRLYTFIILATTLACASESPPLSAIATDHFTVKVPAQWQVKLVAQNTNSWTYAFLDGTNNVFKADVWKGTDFTECFCAPWSSYTIIKKAHEEVRTIRMQHCRTLKIAGECYSLDIHASPENYDDGLIDRILVSLNMKGASTNQTTQTSGTPAPLTGH